MIRKKYISALLTLSIVIMSASGVFATQADNDTNETATTVKSADVLGATPDNTLFPKLNLKIPATEPIPNVFEIGTEHFIVAAIQQRLMNLGFMEEDEPINTFGPATESAVKIFQRQHKDAIAALNPANINIIDGRVGKDTMKLLFSKDAKPYLVKLNDEGEDIRNLNQRLYTLGYLPRQEYASSSKFDEHTRAAVIDLQSTNGIAPDGEVGKMTFQKLHSEDIKSKVLYKGDKSENVKVIQEKLKALGYLTTNVDDVYGNDTFIAVKRFQKLNGCSAVDGTLGPETRETLLNGNPVSFAFSKGDGESAEDAEFREQIKNIQSRLNYLGYMASKDITGTFGAITESAVKTFQSQNGLTSDGIVGTATNIKLFSDAAKKYKKPARPQSSSGSSSSSSSSRGGSSSSSYNDGGYSGNGSVEAFISVAKSKLGKPYVWGSKGPNSFDCSGFVYWCLNNSGVRQSYLTSYGWRSNSRYQRISNFSDIRRGDIIVVSGHVGIALGGGGVIDASSSNGKVVQRSLSDWWRRNFKVAWRVFP